MDARPKIYVITIAYNAEKTIRRTIESVLNQTYTNILYCLRDNGSTDNTYAICKEYASKDERIVLLHNNKNRVYETDEEMAARDIEIGYKFGAALNEKDFICILDADDEYTLDFFERGINFVEAEDLDIVVGGTIFYDAITGQTTGQRTHDENWILSGQDFSDMFLYYHWHTRQVWGKLYRRNTQLGVRDYCLAIQQEELKHCASKIMPYGIDTISTLRSFSKANRVGIMGGYHHMYKESINSVSYTWDENRIISDRILDKLTRNYLIEKCGVVSPVNNEYLMCVYCNAISSTLNVMFNSQIISADKFANLLDIFKCEQTKQLIEWKDNFEIKEQLFQKVADWILMQEESKEQDYAKIAAELLMIIYPELLGHVAQEHIEYLVSKMPDTVGCLLHGDYKKVLKQLRAWYNKYGSDIPALTELELTACYALGKPDYEIFALLIKIKKERPQASAALDIDFRICKLFEKYPLLTNTSANLAVTLSDVFRWVIKENYTQALEALIAAQEIEISNDDTEAYILFAQNLSAIVNNPGAYIYYKKLWISFLLVCSRKEEAKKELDDIEQLLPEDEDFKELRKELMNK